MANTQPIEQSDLVSRISKYTTDDPNRRLWDQFAELPKATTLENWAYECCIASFLPVEGATTYAGALEYIGWLNSLPVKSL